MGVDHLRTLINQQADLMVAVATGGPRVDDKKAEYRARRAEIKTELRRLGLDDPNPHSDLWAWYGHWTRNFSPAHGGYAARRTYISELYATLLDALAHLAEREVGAGLQPAVTGWARLDDQLGQLRERYATARTAEDYQAIGLLCRDVFRSLADATFEEQHVPDGQVIPGAADSVARLGFVSDALAHGETNREIRKVIKANVDLANKVQHNLGATLNDAALIAEATIASVNLIRTLVLGANEIAEQEEGISAVDDPRDWKEWDDRF